MLSRFQSKHWVAHAFAYWLVIGTAMSSAAVIDSFVTVRFCQVGTPLGVLPTRSRVEGDRNPLLVKGG
jgi:hypothetical protein